MATQSALTVIITPSTIYSLQEMDCPDWLVPIFVLALALAIPLYIVRLIKE